MTSRAVRYGFNQNGIAIAIGVRSNQMEYMAGGFSFLPQAITAAAEKSHATRLQCLC